MATRRRDDTAHYYRIKACSVMRPRDLDTARAPATYDVLVVGGGIHGLAMRVRGGEPRAARRARRGRRLRQRRVVQPSEDRARRPAIAAVRPACGRAREVDPRAARAGAHRALAPPPAAVPRRHLPIGRHAAGSRCARRSGSTRWLGRRPQRRRRAGAAPAAAAPASRRPRRCGSSPASGRTS